MAQLAEQPAAAAPRIGKQGDPCVMVIFGAAGDLTARLLLPALYNLARADLLSKEFAVLGVARAQMTDEDFRKRIQDDVKAVLRRLRQRLDSGKASPAASIILPAISVMTNSTRKVKDRLAKIDQRSLDPSELLLLHGDRAEFFWSHR